MGLCRAFQGLLGLVSRINPAAALGNGSSLEAYKVFQGPYTVFEMPHRVLQGLMSPYKALRGLVRRLLRHLRVAEALTDDPFPSPAVEHCFVYGWMLQILKHTCHSQQRSLMDAILCLLDDMLWPFFCMMRTPYYLPQWFFISDDVRPLLSVCRHLRARAKAFACGRTPMMRAERLRHLGRMHPTLAHDCAIYGEPAILWPAAIWKRWKVEEWWWDFTGWMLAETHWMENLRDIETLANGPNLGRLYVHRRFYVSCHQWTYGCYDIPSWEEEACM